MATISNRNPTKGAPFVCAKAISDGMTNSSTGVPFLYLSQLDLCTQDLQVAYIIKSYFVATRFFFVFYSPNCALFLEKQ